MKIIKTQALALLLILPLVGNAEMSGLSDHDMAGVTAQDGLTIQVQGSTAATKIAASNVRLDIDCGGVAGCAGSYASYPQQSYISLDTVKFGAIGNGGAAATAPFTVAANLDVGASGGVPELLLNGSWSRMRLSADAITMKPSTTTSFGAFAFDSQGSFSLRNSRGIFDSSCAPACAAALSFAADGQAYYRQATTAGSPELVLDNMHLSLSASGAELSIRPTGIYFSQATADLNWNYDLRYRANPTLAYRNDQSDLSNFLYVGIESGLVNPITQIKPGGVWLTGSPQYDETTRNGGLNLSLVTDFDPTTFALVLGEGGNTPTLLRFEKWRALKPGTRMLSIPNFTVDAVHGGGAGVPNIPVDFCLGAGRAATSVYCNANFRDRDPTPATGTGSVSRYISSPATGNEGDAIAIMARDLQLLAYPTSVKLVDPVAGTTTFNWGLITTIGDLDATLLAYPGGKTAGTSGVRLDGVISISTPQISAGDWDESRGTHFLLADTDSNMGVGFLDINAMVKVDNLYLELLSTGIKASCSGSAGATTCFSLYADGQFGGGDLFNLSDKNKTVRGFDLIIRLNFSDYAFTLSPAANQLLFSGALVLDSNNKSSNYVMLTEPDYNAAAFKFGQMEGAATISNGSIDLRPGNITADGLPRLTIQQQLDVTQDLKIDDISFNGQNLGRLVIPTGGRVTSIMSLKQQIP
ncbi:MAG: hypothetical protein REI12_10390 [Pedobacter sp.]|nr:hypothetical protein [Pedobacter sp.]